MVAMSPLYSFLLILLQGSVFNNVHSLRFVTEPSNTTIASTGSKPTFTWKLSLTEQEKNKQLQVKFGPWDKELNAAKHYLIMVIQEPSGNQTLLRENYSITKRLYWAGDLAHDYFVAFKLFSAKLNDSGDYGIRVGVDGFPPEHLQSWFTFSVQDPPIITFKSVKDHVLFENMPLLLNCTAKGYPAPWVAWIWNDQVLQNNTNGPTYLLRRHVTTNEAGNYTCMAGNSAGGTKYTFQVSVKVAEPTRDTKATSNIHSSVTKPTEESKATSGTHSTVSEPTGESKHTSGTHSTDPIRKGVQQKSRLGVGLGIGLPTGFALGIIVTVLYMYVRYYKRKRRENYHAANLDALCESDDRDSL